MTNCDRPGSIRWAVFAFQIGRLFMDNETQVRIECLRLAAGIAQPNTGALVAAAEQIYAFVRPDRSQAVKNVARA